MEKPLTKKQIDCLRDAAQRNIDPFDYGSTTISRLKKENLIVGVQNLELKCTEYKITDEGRAALSRA